MPTILDQQYRGDRLRDIVKMVKRSERFSAFDLAVRFGVSLGVVYRDIKTLRKEGLLPKDWGFSRKERAGGQRDEDQGSGLDEKTP